jgi:hypothetical protein
LRELVEVDQPLAQGRHDGPVAILRATIVRPAGFFRTAASGIGVPHAVASFLIVHVLAAGAALFWSNVLPERSASWTGIAAQGALDPLIGFLFSPLAALLFLASTSLLFHISLLILHSAQRPFHATLRVIALSAGPVVLTAVPVLGAPTGWVWSFALAVIGVREVHGTSTARALLAAVLPVLILCALTLAFVVAIAAVIGGVAASL